LTITKAVVSTLFEVPAVTGRRFDSICCSLKAEGTEDFCLEEGVEFFLFFFLGGGREMEGDLVFLDFFLDFMYPIQRRLIGMNSYD
jgi:hypothetical protein